MSGVLGVQLAHGGGTFEPLQPADPCAERDVTSQADGIDGLTERLVLLGIDGAACRLGVSREALTLELAQPGDPHRRRRSTPCARACWTPSSGWRTTGTLPPASELVDEALDNADLNGFLEAAIRALPDSVIDAALKTDDVLIRAIDDLDLRAVLANLDDQDDLNQQVEAAVTQAVKDSLSPASATSCDCWPHSDGGVRQALAPLAHSGRRRRSWQPTPAPPCARARQRPRIRPGAPSSPGTGRR